MWADLAGLRSPVRARLRFSPPLASPCKSDLLPCVEKVELLPACQELPLNSPLPGEHISHVSIPKCRRVRAGEKGWLGGRWQERQTGLQKVQPSLAGRRGSQERALGSSLHGTAQFLAPLLSGSCRQVASLPDPEFLCLSKGLITQSTRPSS